MKVSVVICTYRRLKSLDMILKEWLKQTPDVWLADSSGSFETSLPINHVKFKPDPGNKTRHALALMAQGEYVIKADDDLIPKPGLIEDFLNHSHIDGIFGLMGRTFQGPKYYGYTKVVRAREINIYQSVDMVGILTFSPRKYLAFDLKDCATPIEDLYWHMKAYRDVKKYVIPTKKYLQLPESNDSQCLFKNKEARRIREHFYKIWYERNYRK
jgi:glycosyltransferase involved in cell wall biosynthesis